MPTTSLHPFRHRHAGGPQWQKAMAPVAERDMHVNPVAAGRPPP